MAFEMLAECTHCREILWRGVAVEDDGLERAVTGHECPQRIKNEQQNRRVKSPPRPPDSVSKADVRSAVKQYQALKSHEILERIRREAEAALDEMDERHKTTESGKFGSMEPMVEYLQSKKKSDDDFTMFNGRERRGKSIISLQLAHAVDPQFADGIDFEKYQAVKHSHIIRHEADRVFHARDPVPWWARHPRALREWWVQRHVVRGRAEWQASRGKGGEA